MSRNIEFDLKNEIFSKYQKLTISFYKNNKTGDLMNRISEDVSKVRMYLGPAIMYTINVVVLFIMVITFMIYKNATLTMYVLFPLPILPLLSVLSPHLCFRYHAVVSISLPRPPTIPPITLSSHIFIPSANPKNK